jgi:pimeloyl-ACP methyl ester carboxylesterase
MLWEKMIALDLSRVVPKADLPVYFFHGKYDYTVSCPLARAYLDKLRASIKGFYTFDKSAHSPMFEEPAKMRRIMQQDILAGPNRLADDL